MGLPTIFHICLSAQVKGLIHKQHDPIANLELVEVVMPQHVEHFVTAEVPNPKALVKRVLCDDLAVEVIDFDEVWVLQGEVLEQSPSFGAALAQIRERDAPALHARAVISMLDGHYEDAIVHKVEERTPNCLVLVLVHQHGLVRQPVEREAYAWFRPRQYELVRKHYYLRYGLVARLLMNRLFCVIIADWLEIADEISDLFSGLLRYLLRTQKLSLVNCIELLL